MRIGIIGGGIAGLTTAWLLDGPDEVVLFEAGDDVGGHAHTVTVSADGTNHPIDLGAQYCSPIGFPAHGRLLWQLGFTGQDYVPAPVSMTVSSACNTPMLVTPHAPEEHSGRRAAITGPAARALSVFMTAATEFEATDGSWDVSLAELLDPLPIPAHLKANLIYPWLAFIGCCDNQTAPTLSARAAIAFYTSVSPTRPDHAPVWATLAIGMQETARRLAAALRPGSVRTRSPIQRIRSDASGFTLSDEQGNHTNVDRLVLATPPHATLSLLASLAGTQSIRLALADFPYHPAVVAVHLDPVYMPADRSHWSTVNLQVHDGWTEASHWYGPINGADIFKSWITYRDEPPAETIAQRAFQHLSITTSCVRARRVLAGLQGHGGIYFAGSHLNSIDSQESAVLSAIETARRIGSRSPRLQALDRLEQDIINQIPFVPAPATPPPSAAVRRSLLPRGT